MSYDWSKMCPVLAVLFEVKLNCWAAMSHFLSRRKVGESLMAFHKSCQIISTDGATWLIISVSHRICCLQTTAPIFHLADGDGVLLMLKIGCYPTIPLMPCWKRKKCWKASVKALTHRWRYRLKFHFYPINTHYTRHIYKWTSRFFVEYI